MTKPDTKLVYETPLFVGQGTPLHTTIWLLKSTKVYIPYPPLDLNLWPPRRKHMFLIISPTQAGHCSMQGWTLIMMAWGPSYQQPSLLPRL
jgi:hypothetical protein